MLHLASGQRLDPISAGSDLVSCMRGVKSSFLGLFRACGDLVLNSPRTASSSCLLLQLLPPHAETRFSIESVNGYSVARVADEFHMIGDSVTHTNPLTEWHPPA